ncbi:hypothetical protein BB561_005242 [Smittium simulii]|uniref:L-2-hydroxyglutarate dehydrogenase, mitochondrial n=1 Tax=Smittium simulii TaxID=133385 RepID=A0A2T9YBI2_9FUNG|nr:hypothetical protein BB561_005242 [Smittium simulii]
MSFHNPNSILHSSGKISVYRLLNFCNCGLVSFSFASRRSTVNGFTKLYYNTNTFLRQQNSTLVSEELYKTDHLVIGAGVVGLAVGFTLARRGKSVLLVEKNPSFGQETSSRNSGVIHAGLYYPKEFLKTKLCIEGNGLLYEYLNKYSLPHNRIGKWVVAPKSERKIPTSANNGGFVRNTRCFQELLNDSQYLQQLNTKSQQLGVPTEFLSSKEFNSSEISKVLNAQSVLVSPTTGILDQREYMQSLLFNAELAGADYFSHTSVKRIEPLGSNSGFKVYMESLGSQFEVHAQTVINCAGLYADQVSNMIGTNLVTTNNRSKSLNSKCANSDNKSLRGEIKDDDLVKKQYFYKGTYYTYVSDSARDKPDLSRLINRLIYPIPDKNLGSLGIHLTKTIDGRIMFGPDLEMVERNDDFSVNSNNLETFLEQIKVYLPEIQKHNLQLDYCGIRPKLGNSKSTPLDFIIERSFSMYGITGFINLLGIESPGLTSSLAIGKYIENMLY